MNNIVPFTKPRKRHISNEELIVWLDDLASFLDTSAVGELAGMTCRIAARRIEELTKP